MGLDNWFLVGPFIYFHTSCVRTAKALAKLGGLSLRWSPLISTIISLAGPNEDSEDKLVAIHWETDVVLAFRLNCFIIGAVKCRLGFRRRLSDGKRLNCRKGVVLLAVLCICFPFPLSVLGRMWNSISSVPDHCFFVFFPCTWNEILSKTSEHFLQRPCDKWGGSQADPGYKWANSWDYGTFHIGDQRMLRRACASAQSRRSLRCSHTWSIEEDKGFDQKSDI